MSAGQSELDKGLISGNRILENEKEQQHCFRKPSLSMPQVVNVGSIDIARANSIWLDKKAGRKNAVNKGTSPVLPPSGGSTEDCFLYTVCQIVYQSLSRHRKAPESSSGEM